MRAPLRLLLATGVVLASAAFAEVLPVRDDPALLYAPHQEDGRFFNPWTHERRSLWRVLKWQFSNNPYDKSQPIEVSVRANDGSSLGTGAPAAARSSQLANCGVEDR